VPPRRAFRESIEQQNERANRLIDRGDLEFSASVASEAIRQSSELYGPHHPQTANSIVVLAHVMHRRGDLNAAATHYDQAAYIFNKHKKKCLPDLGVCLRELGLIHCKVGRHATALTYLASAASIYDQVYGAKDVVRAMTLAEMATCHYRLGQYEQARALYAEAYPILDEDGDDDHPYLIEIREILVAMLKQERLAAG